MESHSCAGRFAKSSARAFSVLILSACELIAATSLTRAIDNTPAPPIPETPAGHAPGSWLAAFDSGNSERIESFDRAHYPWANAGGMIALRMHTGGYALLDIDDSGKLWITFHVKEKTGGARMSGSLVVESFNPRIISHLLLAPDTADSQRITVDAAERSRVLASAAKARCTLMP